MYLDNKFAIISRLIWFAVSALSYSMVCININSIFLLLSVSKLFLKQILVFELDFENWLICKSCVSNLVPRSFGKQFELEHSHYFFLVYKVDNTVKSVTVSTEVGRNGKAFGMFWSTLQCLHWWENLIWFVHTVRERYRNLF